MNFKRLSKKNRPLYIEATIFFGVYLILNHAIFWRSIFLDNIFLLILLPTISGSIAGMIFLFLFSHEDFFKFAKMLEKKEMKAESKWLKRFRHYGKIVTSFIVGTIGGPIFAALTVRILLRDFRHRYLLVALINIPSALFSIGLVKGTFSIIF